MTLGKAKELLLDVYKEGHAGTSELDSASTSTAGFKYNIKSILLKADQQPGTRCHNESDHTLQLLPAEARKEIFKYLLTSSELGEASCISQSQNYGANAHYNLSPAILQVCKKFYEERMEILYHSNTFMIEFLDDIRQDSLDVLLPLTACSPLTRWKNIPLNEMTQAPSSIEESLLMDLPALKYVKKWKIVLSARYRDFEADIMPLSQLEFIMFSRLLDEYQSQVKGGLIDLEVVIIPKGIEVYNGHLDDTQLQKHLRPLHFLRNILRVTIRTANIAEVPDFVCSDEWNLSPLVTESQLPSSSHIRYLKELLQGNSEIELCTKMFASIEIYAMTFERDAEFKKDMSMSTNSYQKKSRYELNTLDRNPFWDTTFNLHGVIHTVEFGLARARHLADIQYKNVDDTIPFKQERSKILEFLERQFGGIKTASDEIVSFMKIQKRENGIFSPHFIHRSFDLICYTEAVVLLEEYATSFARELDPSTKRAMRVRQELFQARYNSMNRELALKQCDIAYRLRDTYLFNENFRIAVKDMDLQYREILEARAKIYQWDLSKTTPDVDIHNLPALADWETQWELLEPNVTVQTQVESYMQNYQQLRESSTTQVLTEVGANDSSTSETGYVGDLYDMVDGSTNLHLNHDVLSDIDILELGNEEIDLIGWESLPFHDDDDDFYMLTYQPDDTTSQSSNPSLNPNPNPNPDSDSNSNDSEYDYYEDLFIDHPDDESMYLHSEDGNEEIAEGICAQYHDINTGGSIYHVLPWLANSKNSLSHVFLWLSSSQE
ncbi:hypothetical protein EYC80_002370 [Monilinia laxa]|uniref:Uncharacterized protein n=1 Tax=Monilinia laxa TaxID=61186 RepID=A0A5N6K4A6_MONLA|nr:hypothetical protein EYC80_002370 [Monilinia laxa]